MLLILCAFKNFGVAFCAAVCAANQRMVRLVGPLRPDAIKGAAHARNGWKILGQVMSAADAEVIGELPTHTDRRLLHQHPARG